MGDRAPQRGAPRAGSLDLNDRRPVIDLHQAAAFALSDIIVDPAVPFQVLWSGGFAPSRRRGVRVGDGAEKKRQ